MGHRRRPRLHFVTNRENAMPFIPAADTARVSMHFRQDGQEVENQFYVVKAAPFSTADLNNLAAIAVAWWVASMRPNLANTLTLTEVVAKAMDSVGAPEIVYTTGLPTSGSNAGVSLPNNVTIAIKLLTATSGRSFRGRQYILGLLQGELGVDQNTITAAAVTAFTNAYNSLITSIQASFIPGLAIAS